MCGIAVYYNKTGITKDSLAASLASLELVRHRGPNGDGVALINTKTGDIKFLRTQDTPADISATLTITGYQDCSADLFLGHRRLSIIDLSSGGFQPMTDAHGNCIVFNGEVYNYLEIKEELKKLGLLFKTNSDTEVVLTAYRTWGKDCLQKFNGMWSICIWDAMHKRFFISNDRFGVKPLYYYEQAGSFILASEIKQLKAYTNNPLTINPNNLSDFLTEGYTDTSENTIYDKVYRFRKAHYVLFNSIDYQQGFLKDNQVRYYQINTKRTTLGEEGAIAAFRKLLYDAVRLRMPADVDFGFAISGGIDSSAILYTARNIIRNENINHKLIGFSAIFPGHKQSDESKFVKIVSADLPCLTIYSNPMEEFSIDSFEQHVYHQDEPLSDTSFLAQWSVYAKVKQIGIKILLNGQGADEVFAGYHHHFYRYCRQLLIQGKLSEYFSLVNQYAEIKQIRSERVHKIIFDEIKLKTKMLLGIARFDSALVKYWNKIDTLGEMLKGDFDTFQLPTYLRVDDRNSMAHSIESRHPFMDYRLVEFGYLLPYNLLIKNGWQKFLIRKSMHEMPEAIRYRKDKKGFTTPQESWVEKYKKEFENYLPYNKRTFGKEHPSPDRYKNYALGAWVKMNGM